MDPSGDVPHSHGKNCMKHITNSLKKPIVQSEATNLRKNNTSVKSKRTNGQTIIYNTLNKKLMIEQHELHLPLKWTQLLWKG